MTTPKRRRPENLGGVHEFEVGITDLYGDGSRLHYVVQLPHSCDQWVISDHRDKATAITELETFIAEATAALEKLRATP